MCTARGSTTDTRCRSPTAAATVQPVLGQRPEQGGLLEGQVATGRLEAGLARSDLPGGLHRHRDEQTRLDRDRLVVHDHPAVPAKDGVDVFDPVMEVAMPHGLRTWGWLDLIDLEGTHAELLADPFVEQAGGGVGPGPAVIELGSAIW